MAEKVSVEVKEANLARKVTDDKQCSMVDANYKQDYLRRKKWVAVLNAEETTNKI